MDALKMVSRISAAALAAALVFANTGAQPHGSKTASAEPIRVSARAHAEQALAEARQAAERYGNVKVALAEGYIADPSNSCETAETIGRPKEEGVMGLHYFRPDLLGITGTAPRVDGVGTHTDFTKPAVLLYEPQADGSLVLVGVENLVFEKAWRAANAGRPQFAGVAFDRMADDPATAIDEAHGFEPHYDLHVWLFRDNPRGMFAQFNPAVSCEFATTKQAAN